MVIHPNPRDISHSGIWDRQTGRYIPINGGSRSRLPIEDDKHIRRYHGLVGINESLTESIFTIGALFKQLGGKPVIPPGDLGKLVQLLLAAKEEQIEHRHIAK